jgi:tetratricopeptide (TPR) repeat protein
MIAQHQGDYPEARRLYAQSLDIKERLGDQGGRATTLHQLGTIAFVQGDYPEARRLYAQSLDIFERLGDQGGRAQSLGQLGLLAYVQEDYKHALVYTIQAYLLFDFLSAPERELAQRLLARIYKHLDEATFITHWHTLAGDHPLPPLVHE